MQAIFLRVKFIAKGFKLTIVNSLKIVAFRERLSLRPEHDYLKWSYNVKVSFKEPGSARQKSLYIAENLDLLNIYEVVDRSDGTKLGVVRYHFGIWEILDENNQYLTISPQEGILNEVFFLKRIPHVVKDSEGNIIGEIKKVSPFFLPLFYKYIIDFSCGKNACVDRRLVMGALILFIFAHERVGAIEKLKYYIASKLGLRPKDKPFVLKKRTIFSKDVKRSVVRM